MSEGAWHDAGADDAPADGTLREVVVAGRPVLLARVEGSWLAVDGDCTHDACPLVDGVLDGRRLECTCHGAAFDVVTGAVVAPPATEPLPTFPVRLRDGRIEVAR